MGRLTFATAVLAAALAVAACADSKPDVSSRNLSPEATVTTGAHGPSTGDSSTVPVTQPGIATSTDGGGRGDATTPTTRSTDAASTTGSAAAASAVSTAPATSSSTTSPSSEDDPILQQIDTETAEIQKLLDELKQTMTT